MKTKMLVFVLVCFSLTARSQDTTGQSKTNSKFYKFFHPEAEKKASDSTTAGTTTAVPENKIPAASPVPVKDTLSRTAANLLPQPKADSLPPAGKKIPATPLSMPANTPYRDTRLGSSSPLYNTYEKNADGAGAVTTNPNKG